MRAGVHTGEIEQANGGVRGVAVQIAARMAAVARPGEVLVSGTVKDIVAGSGIASRSAASTSCTAAHPASG